MDIGQLLDDIREAVRKHPEISGHLHRAITREFQRSVPMVGTLEKIKIRYTGDGWSSSFEAWRGLGQVLCGGTAKCVDGGTVYNVDHAGVYAQGSIGDGKWTEE